MDDLDATAINQSSMSERIFQRLIDWTECGAAEYKPSYAEWSALCGYRQRDHGRRAAESRDEFPSPHVRPQA